MKTQCLHLALAGLIYLICATNPVSAQGVYRFATYNLKGYRLLATQTRPSISESRQKMVQQVIKKVDADVLALQEIGPEPDLVQLKSALANLDSPYPFHAHVVGDDPEIHLGILSRLPLESIILHTNQSFMHFGKRHRVRRGFLEVSVQLKSREKITLLVAHLKSQLPVIWADADVFRIEEARLLRNRVETLLQQNAHHRIVVAGDLNDHPNSRALKILLSRGRLALHDSRPLGYSGPPDPAWNQGNAGAWTYHYTREDSWHRYDYILMSPSLLQHWLPETSRVYSEPDWVDASDHRPVYVDLKWDP